MPSPCGCFPALSAAFLPTNLFFGCLGFSGSKSCSSASWPSPRLACALSSSIYCVAVKVATVTFGCNSNNENRGNNGGTKCQESAASLKFPAIPYLRPPSQSRIQRAPSASSTVRSLFFKGRERLIMRPLVQRQSLVTLIRQPARRSFTSTPRRLAEEVRIVEVAPRDGLQNEKISIPLETKIELIRRLSQTGVKNIEAGSFVSPKWVPQVSRLYQTSDSLSVVPRKTPS